MSLLFATVAMLAVAAPMPEAAPEPNPDHLSAVLDELGDKPPPPPPPPPSPVEVWASQVRVVGLTEAQAAVFTPSAEQWRSALSSSATSFALGISSEGRLYGMGPDSRFLLVADRVGEIVDLEVVVLGFKPDLYHDPEEGCGLHILPLTVLAQALFSWRHALTESLAPGSGNPLIAALADGSVRVRLVDDASRSELVFAAFPTRSGPSFLSQVWYIEKDVATPISLDRLDLMLLWLEPPGRVDLDGKLRPYNQIYKFLGARGTGACAITPG